MEPIILVWGVLEIIDTVRGMREQKCTLVVSAIQIIYTQPETRISFSHCLGALANRLPEIYNC